MKTVSFRMPQFNERGEQSGWGTVHYGTVVDDYGDGYFGIEVKLTREQSREHRERTGRWKDNAIYNVRHDWIMNSGKE